MSRQSAWERVLAAVVAASLLSACRLLLPPEPQQWKELRPPYTEEEINEYQLVRVVTDEKPETCLGQPHLGRNEQGSYVEREA